MSLSQNILSTKENKELQKVSVSHSSSTVFWALFNNHHEIDTRVSFLNHFLLKRGIPSVSMRLCVRHMDGSLLKEISEEVSEPRVYSYSLASILSPLGIESGEFSVYIEFTSANNLSVPFCAVTSDIYSNCLVDIVHTYGRALENHEISSAIDFNLSHETGWSIWNFGDHISNHAIFHNGRIHSNVSFDLFILKEGIEIFRLENLCHRLKPFASCRLHLEDILSKATTCPQLFTDLKSAIPGTIDVKISISGLQGSFPRLLFASIRHLGDPDPALIDSVKNINFTHSNFDFDNAVQPKSVLNYGFINNPFYPEGVESGFRYYPCKDLSLTKLDSRILDSLFFAYKL